MGVGVGGWEGGYAEKQITEGVLKVYTIEIFSNVPFLVVFLCVECNISQVLKSKDCDRVQLQDYSKHSH